MNERRFGFASIAPPGPIQDAAVRDIVGYSNGAAPAIVLIGPPNLPGTPHYNATQAQNAATVAGTCRAERDVASQALLAAGMDPSTINQAIQAADTYFIGQLGLSMNSPTRVPGSRWGVRR